MQSTAGPSISPPSYYVVLAVAAYVSSEDSAPHAGASQAGHLELLAQSKPTDHSNTNGPMATPGKPWKGASRITLSVCIF